MTMLVAKKRLVVYRCPVHANFVSLCVEEEGTGTRILGGKCCVDQYKEVHWWIPTPDQWRNLQRACDEALEELEDDE
jgi:hypothetical protein